LIFLVHSQPTESNSEGDQTERYEDVGTEGTKVCECTDDQQDGDLDCEGDAVAKQDDGIGGAV
jgi:hypothetical protein